VAVLAPWSNAMLCQTRRDRLIDQVVRLVNFAKCRVLIVSKSRRTFGIGKFGSSRAI
jgi:hypothetical protein